MSLLRGFETPAGGDEGERGEEEEGEGGGIPHLQPGDGESGQGHGKEAQPVPGKAWNTGIVNSQLGVKTDIYNTSYFT